MCQGLTTPSENDLSFSVEPKKETNNGIDIKYENRSIYSNPYRVLTNVIFPYLTHSVNQNMFNLRDN